MSVSRKYLRKIKTGIILELLALAVLFVPMYRNDGQEAAEASSDDYIKWVEFGVPNEALSRAYELDRDTYGEEVHIEWIPLLSYIAAKHGGEFPKGSISEIDKTAQMLLDKETTLQKLTKDMKYYPYYLEAYTAVLGGMVGNFRVETVDESGAKKWEEKYGLKAFSPIAKGFPYEDYDDFGTSRSYGYSRPHLGHDMMGQIGTPI